MAVPDLTDAIDHLRQKDVDAAIAALEHKVEELPAHLTAHVLLARTYEAKREWTKALTCWENVYFLMPNSPVGQAGKARVLRRINERDEDVDAPDAASSPETAEGDEADEDAPDAATGSAPPSGLEQLRQRAEAEARSGGARPGLAASSPSSAETSASDAEASNAEEDSPAPEEEVDQIDEDEDLDHLIDKLKSARIEPDPDAEEEVPAPDLDTDVDDLVSVTLARIHEAQDQYRKAAQIYVRLASQEPDRAREHLEKAAAMRKKADRAARED